MRLNGRVVGGLLLLAAGAAAQGNPAAPKIGTVHLQNALLTTREGQAAAQALQSKAEPKEQALKQLQSEILAMREQLSKSNAVASPEKQESLSREIEQKTKTFNRRLEDFQAEMDQEQGRLLKQLGSRMLAVINKYGARGGYAVILDVSAPQSPVLYFGSTLDVTSDVVKMFDESPPGKP